MVKTVRNKGTGSIQGRYSTCVVGKELQDKEDSLRTSNEKVFKKKRVIRTATKRTETI